MEIAPGLRDFFATALPLFGTPDHAQYAISVDWTQGGTIMVFEPGLFDDCRWTMEMIDELAESIMSTLEQDLFAMAGPRSATARIRIQSARMVREYLLTVSIADEEPARALPVPTARSALLDVPVPARRFSFDED